MRAAGTYLKWLALTFLGAAALMLMLSANALVYEYREAPIAKLFQYQVEKINRGIQAETIFLGDSSLGNSIDAQLFSQLSGKSAMNLALTGSHGFGGSLALLQRILAGYRPANVVMMNSIDIMRREAEYQGYLFTADERSLRDEPWKLQVRLAAAIGRRLTSLSTAMESIERWSPFTKKRAAGLSFDDDYVAQNAAEIGRLSVGEMAPRDPDEIKPEKIVFLHRIVELCQHARLNCIFAFGPVIDVQCVRSAAYIASAAELIRSAGLKVVGGVPVCVPLDQIGDAMDHVMPSAKREYTRRYHDLLAPYLH